MTSDDLVRTAMTRGDHLDDVKRAQLWSQLEARLPSSPPGRAWSPFRVRFAVRTGFAVAALAAAVALVLFAHVHVGAPPSTDAFIAPPDTTLALRLGEHTRAILVGPAHVASVETSPTSTVVHFRSGTLLAEFEGGGGRSLRILAPGATIDIVGTLFAVESSTEKSCVSVEHGTVRFTSAGRVVMVTGGQSACTDTVFVRAISPSVHDALVHHENTRIADAPSLPSSSPASSPPLVFAPFPTLLPSLSSSATPSSSATLSSSTTPPRTAAVPTTVTGSVSVTSEPLQPATPPIPVARRPSASTSSTTIASSNVAKKTLSSSPTVSASLAGNETVSDAAPLPDTGQASPDTGRDIATIQSPASVSSLAVTTSPSTKASATTATSYAGASNTNDAAWSIVRSPSADSSSRTDSPPSRAGSPPSPTRSATMTVSSSLSSEPTAGTRDPTTPDALYADAEQALARSDLNGAERALAQLIALRPTSSLLDEALYEHARIAFLHRAWLTAQRDLGQLAGIPNSALAEQGAFLGCRVALEAHDDSAADCLTTFRTEYQSSPHDRDALAGLAELAYQRGGCLHARVYIDELLARYAGSQVARTWRQRCETVR